MKNIPQINVSSTNIFNHLTPHKIRGVYKLLICWSLYVSILHHSSFISLFVLSNNHKFIHVISRTCNDEVVSLVLGQNQAEEEYEEAD